MGDIVEHLKSCAKMHGGGPDGSYTAAVDEIERLRKTLADTEEHILQRRDQIVALEIQIDRQRFWAALKIERLRAELAERNEALEKLIDVATTYNCPSCGRKWGDGEGLAASCERHCYDSGPCKDGTYLACCACLCGEDGVRADEQSSSEDILEDKPHSDIGHGRAARTARNKRQT